MVAMVVVVIGSAGDACVETCDIQNFSNFYRDFPII